MKRVTYTLDAATVDRVDSLAKRWKVSRSEAIRRAVAAASVGSNRDGLSALRAAQSRMAMTKKKAATWTREISEGRRAWTSTGTS